jgi:TonB family protein
MAADMPQRTALESMAPAVVGIGLLHVLGGMLIWIVLPMLPVNAVKGVRERWVWRSPGDFVAEKPKYQWSKLAQLSALVGPPVPAKITVAAPVAAQASNVPEAPVTKPQPPKKIETASAPATVVSPQMQAASVPESGRAANKYITLSAIKPAPRLTKPTIGLLDIAKLNELEREQERMQNLTGMDAVESALQQTLLRTWEPPSIDLVPGEQRRVSVELALEKDGTVKDAIITSPSGSAALDASVRAALARVKKIPESLPASFPKERYAVRVNLQIE